MSPSTMHTSVLAREELRIFEELISQAPKFLRMNNLDGPVQCHGEANKLVGSF